MIYPFETMYNGSAARFISFDTAAFLIPTDPEDDTARDVANSDEPPHKSPENSTVEEIDKRDEIPGDKDEEEKDNPDPQDYRPQRDPSIDNPSGQGNPYS